MSTDSSKHLFKLVNGGINQGKTIHMAYEMAAEIYAQREEILRAFVAKYGFQPDEVEQVEEYLPAGIRWYVRKRA